MKMAKLNGGSFSSQFPANQTEKIITYFVLEIFLILFSIIQTNLIIIFSLPWRFFSEHKLHAYTLDKY